MAIVPKNTLKTYFERGDKPLESEFVSLIDSLRHEEENIPISEITDLVQALEDRQLRSEKGQGNGYAGLDNTAKVPLSQLPDFAFLIKRADFASLDVTGAERNIYLTENDNKLFYWDGAGYVEMSISEIITAENGITKTDSVIKLGGQLSENTNIDANNLEFFITNVGYFTVSSTKSEINATGNIYINSSSILLLRGSTNVKLESNGFIEIQAIGGSARLRTANLSDTREFQFPNVSGTFALTTDIPATQTTTDQYFTSSVVTGAIGSTGASVTFTTELKNIPYVFINGLRFKVGVNATPANNICFFGPDASTVRTSLGAIVSGDLLFWNPLFANSFDLATTDEIILNYTKV